MKNMLIQFIDNVQSTNKLLSEMVMNGHASGSAIPPFFALCTDHQTAGRGMGSNTWFSDRGRNILASFYFEPDLPASRQFIFNQYFALSTLVFLRKRLPNTLIKWPNDMYVEGKKIAGILIEHAVTGDHLQHTIAGIGININQHHFPDDIPHPTSLLLETGNESDPHTLLEEYWQILHDQFPICGLAHADQLKARYISNLYLYNEYHDYNIQGIRTEARITDLDKYGRLVLHDRNGKQYVCGFKEAQPL